jgi:glutamate N-acetyltransferase/amino-acid N-acetyltransferase
MIHPNLGTMLCFITSDVAIEAQALDKALRQAVKRSFNRLTVDGDTSTNDTVLVMANGRAGNSIIKEKSDDYQVFTEALDYVCKTLAAKMARDGEGASKLITVEVEGAANEDEAAILARSVAGSSLVKAAMFGADANWGRVLCALGYAGVDFDPARVSVSFKAANEGGEESESIRVFREGLPLNFDEDAAKALLSKDQVTIMVTMGNGPGRAEAWGCDLSYDYVKINGDYRT